MRSDGTHPRLQSCANCPHLGWQHYGGVCVADGADTGFLACGCPGFQHPRAPAAVALSRGLNRPVAGRKTKGTRYPMEGD